MSEYKYFTLDEFACHETGENKIKPAFVHRMDTLRGRCGFPLVVTSGYRSPRHSIEAAKPGGPGEHSEGHAADVKVATATQRYVLLREALAMGFTGIGIDDEFIHLDDRSGAGVVWLYA